MVNVISILSSKSLDGQAWRYLEPLCRHLSAFYSLFFKFNEWYTKQQVTAIAILFLKDKIIQ